MTGQVGKGVGAFTYPTGVTFADGGTLYLAYGHGDRVQAFDTGGDFLRNWGEPFALGIYGPFKCWLTTATPIAIGPEGNVFVADVHNDRTFYVHKTMRKSS